jgi:hypothetical protein
MGAAIGVVGHVFNKHMHVVRKTKMTKTVPHVALYLANANAAVAMDTKGRSVARRLEH